MNRRVAIRAARLFDSRTAELRPRPLVMVEDARITAVTFDRLDPPSDVEVLDLGDVTLLPGLVDTHLHLAFDASADPVARLSTQSDDELDAAMAAAARRA